MSTSMRIMAMVALCCVCNMGSDAGQAQQADGQDAVDETGVTIELTKLEVSDSSLELDYKITNSSDDDVWVCSKPSSIPFEVYLTHDPQTLLIRKRLDVPSTFIWSRPPAAGTYVRIVPGATQMDSMRLDLPVTPRSVYASVGPEVPQTVRRLVLEIGYYDEDLPALVRSILDVAGNCSPQSWYVYPDFLKTYFRGLLVRNSLSGFNAINKDPYGEGRVSIEYSYQALTGEKVLRVEINGVSIRYGVEGEVRG